MGEDSVAETIELDQRHIQRSGSASQNQRQRRSWINIVDKRSGWSGGCLYRLSFGFSLGFLRVSLRFFKGFFSVSSRVSLGQMMV